MDSKTLKRRALNNLQGNWGLSVGVALLAALLGGATVSGTMNLNIDQEILAELPPNVLAVIAAIASVLSILSFVQFILGGTVNLGYTRFLLDQHDGNELNFRTLFSQFDRFGVGFLQKFLRGLYIFLWSLLLIVPGIVKTYSYAMTPYILADHPEMTANEAITASRKLMDGHKWELFVLQLSFIGWHFVGMLTFGLAYIWIIPYMSTTTAHFYNYLKSQDYVGA